MRLPVVHISDELPGNSVVPVRRVHRIDALELIRVDSLRPMHQIDEFSQARVGYVHATQTGRHSLS